jgi:flavorubredoxin
MDTRIDEIADGIYRFSTLIPDIAPPAGFTFNQFLVMGAEPLLFHCGMRGLFPSVSAAMAKVMPVDRLRWISFGHVEADECGAMNQWLAAAPRAEIAHGMTACMVSLNDLADRLPRTLQDGEVIDLGGKKIRYIDTPHVPHGWEAGVLYEETTKTLLCGDLFTHVGGSAALTESDIVAPAIAAEESFQASSLAPAMGRTLRRLGSLVPETLALMHGSSFRGDAGTALNNLAGYYDTRRARMVA